MQHQHYANMSVQYTAIFHGYKNDHFQMKKFNIFLIFGQNIDCGYTLELPQSMFWSKNKKNVYPCNPSFTIKKWGVRGCSLHGLVFVMNCQLEPLTRVNDTVRSVDVPDLCEN